MGTPPIAWTYIPTSAFASAGAASLTRTLARLSGGIVRACVIGDPLPG
jgi:hypothetical protein